jgi:hypothetical protein
MKLTPYLNTARSIRALVICALTLLGVVAAQADNFFDDSVSGIDLGNASGGSTGTHKSWAIFALSGGVTITDASLDGSYDVLGNVGIAGAGGLTLSLSKIQGSVFRDSGAFTNSGGIVTGTNTTGNGAYLNTGVSNANSASSTAQLLPRATSGLTLGGGLAGGLLTNDTTALTLNNTAGSISPATGPAGAGTYVLNVADVILAGAGAILTLNGNGVAGAVNYVVNVNRYLTLSTAAQIQLGNGLTPQNVLFNVKSNATPYDVTVSGGSVVNGIILAPTRTVKLTGASTVYGEVIAKGVSLSGRSKVINPTVTN